MRVYNICEFKLHFLSGGCCWCCCQQSAEYLGADWYKVTGKKHKYNVLFNQRLENRFYHPVNLCWLIEVGRADCFKCCLLDWWEKVWLANLMPDARLKSVVSVFRLLNFWWLLRQKVIGDLRNSASANIKKHSKLKSLHVVVSRKWNMEIRMLPGNLIEKCLPT